MTKKDLIREIALSSGLTQKDTETFIESFTECVEEAITNGEIVKLNSFGTFGMKKNAPRTAFNLQTKKKMTIPERFVPYFKFSSLIKKEMKQLPV